MQDAEFPPNNHKKQNSGIEALRTHSPHTAVEYPEAINLQITYPDTNLPKLSYHYCHCLILHNFKNDPNN